MKKFDRIFIVGIILFLMLIAAVNIFVKNHDFSNEGRDYKVALNRIEQAIDSYEEREGKAPDNLEDLYNAEGIASFSGLLELDFVELKQGQEAMNKLIANENADYYIVITKEYMYKITYIADNSANNKLLIYLNIILLIVAAILIIVYIFLRRSILQPFNEFSRLPYELAKGNMNKPLKETKNKYFGKFIWGMNMLRENIEESKAKELEIQRDKKMLMLSLSHDIKTPLNAISLYAKAISKNLYKDEDRKRQVADNINLKVDEIECYISDIVKASSEDFLNFEVNNTEVYTGEILGFIEDYYRDKTNLNNIDFMIDDYPNCLVHGDKDRIIEVIQNIIENAIKYGDGRRIWIETAKDAEEYEIKISNTGCNLQDNELSHMFDSFFRGTNVGNKNGSGLGLYICRQLMHLMEGEILANIINADKERYMEIKLVLRVI